MTSLFQRSLLVILTLALVCLSALKLCADEVEVWDDKRQKKTRYVGTILEFKQTFISIELANGALREIPVERLSDFVADWGMAFGQAEILRADFQFDDALPLYRQAFRNHNSVWLRRHNIARQIACLSALGQWVEAADLYIEGLSSVNDDALYLEILPLIWSRQTITPQMLQRASNWISSDSSEITQLLGASWLMDSPKRTDAITTLTRIENSNNSSLALLAATQKWRPLVPMVKESQLQRWQQIVLRMPHTLRAGPYYLLAHGFARNNESQNAILNWMRVPIHYPGQYQLSAEALLESARVLDQLERDTEAVRLLREVTGKYQDTFAARRAEAIVGQIQNRLSPNEK